MSVRLVQTKMMGLPVWNGEMFAVPAVGQVFVAHLRNRLFPSSWGIQMWCALQDRWQSLRNCGLNSVCWLRKVLLEALLLNQRRWKNKDTVSLQCIQQCRACDCLSYFLTARDTRHQQVKGGEVYFDLQFVEVLVCTRLVPWQGGT